ncbi:MAG: excinuclease ABC subunit UvrC [Bdellovibrionota bacterium]
MTQKIDELKEKIKIYPTQSGVYLMKNSAEKIIYVGKAKNLRNRVKSYFTGMNDHTPKTKILVQNIHLIEYILTKTEVEAFLLEASLIKKHRPKYNIRLRDDKSYPYIKITWNETYPRLYLSRHVKKDGSLYFGPYTSGAAVFGTIRFLNRTFKIRDCTDSMFKSRKRPCMTHQIGRCTAPCVDYVSKKEYRDEIEGALLFLKGQNKKVVKTMTERMKEAAREEKFEVAARLRDSIESIKTILEKQAVVNDSSDKDQDALGFYGDEEGCLVETIHIRKGRVIGTRDHMLVGLNPNGDGEDPREWLVSFLNQYYEDNIIPDEVLLPVDLGSDINKLFENVLKERSGRKTVVKYATAEKAQRLVEMANQNAKAHFEKQKSAQEAKLRGLDEIQKKLNLSQRPLRIECFDISTFQGTETVASQVVFENGHPSKDNYRRYKIKTVEGTNDFASMEEVLRRRFAHAEWDYPDLIVIDGGKGQLSVVVKVLESLGKTEIPVCGLAKARTESDFQAQEVSASEERFFLPGRQNPVTFKSNSEALHILTGLRDEAHRFAITYHRKIRGERSLSSELDFIIGLGEKRKKLLLSRYASIDEIRNAEPKDLAQIKGFNRVLAERVLMQLNEDDSEEAPIEN